MSRIRISEPSGSARTTMSLNSWGVCSRPIVVTGIVSWVPGGAGSPPSRPAGLVAFCSRTAAATSFTVTPSCAILSGSSWISIENCNPPNVVALPTPCTPFSSSSTYNFM